MSLDRKINRIQFLSGNSLKVIAVLTMLIDHLCKIVLQWLLSNYWGAMADNGQMSWERFREIDYFIRFDLQSIGTIAFPLFCFLLAEGFQHTRSKKRYIGLMLAFALISEVPFDIGFFSAYSRMEDTFPFYLKYQNVFFTYLCSMGTLWVLEQTKRIKQKPLEKLLQGIIVLGAYLFNEEILQGDYGGYGLLLIITAYALHKKRLLQIVGMIAVNLIFYKNFSVITDWFRISFAVAMLLILFYNGERGKKNLKLFFYNFYPVHIVVIGLLDWMIFTVFGVFS